MGDVKSKNLYELLGNTSDQDSDREPEPPTKAVDKQGGRHGKRDAPQAAPAEPEASTSGRGRGGQRSGGFTGNEAAFRDRATGRNRNKAQPTEEAQDGARPRESGPGMRRGGGRGGPRRGGDRHSRTGISEHQKQEGHGWGEKTGNGEWGDEKAGDAIAAQETKAAAAEGEWDADKNDKWAESAVPATIPEDGPTFQEKEQEPEEEDKSVSYADYVAEQARKKLEGLGLKEARAPNEGSKENKKWKSAKELNKSETEDYFKGEEKARRERERSSKKQLLDIDYAFKESSRGSDSRGRGGRGGEFRGRGERGGRGRGGERGGRGRGERGDFHRGRGGERGGRGRAAREGAGPGLAVNDDSAFPSLGAK